MAFHKKNLFNLNKEERMKIISDKLSHIHGIDYFSKNKTEIIDLISELNDFTIVHNDINM
jgi:hypothetical protein